LIPIIISTLKTKLYASSYLTY